MMPTRLRLAAATALLVSILVAGPALAQGMSQKEADQTLLEALALHGLLNNSDRAIPNKVACARLSKAGLTLSAYWKAVCEVEKLPPPQGLSCLKAFFSCMQKENSGKLPQGGTFDCEGRLKRCQAGGK